MDWSAQTLRLIYEASKQPYASHRPTGYDAWPYNSGSEADVEQFLHDMVSDLEQSDITTVEADFDSFGGGYASFIEVWSSKKDGNSKRPYLGSGEEMTGIVVYVSRIAPVAVYGAGHRTRHAHGRTSNFVEYDTIGTLPSGNWQTVLKEICAKLENHGIQVTDAKTLLQRLPFEASIETNLGNYILDALTFSATAGIINV